MITQIKTKVVKAGQWKHKHKCAGCALVDAINSVFGAFSQCKAVYTNDYATMFKALVNARAEIEKHMGVKQQ